MSTTNFFQADTEAKCDVCNDMTGGAFTSLFGGIRAASMPRFNQVYHTFGECKHKVCSCCINGSLDPKLFIAPVVDGQPLADCIKIQCTKCLQDAHHQHTEKKSVNTVDQADTQDTKDNPFIIPSFGIMSPNKMWPCSYISGFPIE